MRLETLFRLSTYLTLLASSLAVTHAEELVLPWIVPFTGGFAAFWLAALILEVYFPLPKRWHIRVGNALGFGILLAALAMGWSAYHTQQLKPEEAIEYTFSARLLPYLGPLVMILLIAKLLLPKRANDYWYLHAIGLIQMALACGLSSQPGMGLFLLAYLGLGSWSLACFNLCRGIANASPSPSDPSPLANARAPWRVLGLGQATKWLLCVGGFGLALFLFTPQRGGSDLTKIILTPTTGAPDAGIDLNPTGELEVDETVVLEVVAEDAQGNPKLDLSLKQLWRGATMSTYNAGRWHRSVASQPFAITRHSTLLDLGQDQFYLTFTVDPRQTKGLFLADPVAPSAKDPAAWPVVSLMEDRQAVNFGLARDSTLAAQPALRAGKYRYKQVALPLEAFGGGRPVDAEGRQGVSMDQVDGIRIFTATLLKRLVDEGKLAASDLEKEEPGQKTNLVKQAAQEKTARVLADYLAKSGEYSYSLHRRRKDKNLDPTEDFLVNVKEGHCERFATALALMLRSCGLRTRLVVGFRGHDPLGDGRYLIRHSDGHSWVEAVVIRPTWQVSRQELPFLGAGMTALAASSDGPGTWAALSSLVAHKSNPTRYWLTLDPTPINLSARADESSSWTAFMESLRQTWFSWRATWKNFIVELNTDQQLELGAAVVRPLAGGWTTKTGDGSSPDQVQRYESGLWPWLLPVPFVIVGLWLARRLRARLDRRPASPKQLAFYARMLDLLRRGLNVDPRPSQTPREVVADIEALLGRRGIDGEALAVPAAVVHSFYRARYGGCDLTESLQRDIERGLQTLEIALINGK